MVIELGLPGGVDSEFANVAPVTMDECPTGIVFGNSAVSAFENPPQ